MDGEQSAAKRRAGRPPKLTAELVEELAAVVRAHPRGSKSDCVRRFKAKTGVSLSTPSLDKYLASAGIRRVPRGQRAGPAHQGGAAERRKRYGDRPHYRMEGEPGDFPSSLTDVEWELVKDLFGPRPTDWWGTPSRVSASAKRRRSALVLDWQTMTSRDTDPFLCAPGGGPCGRVGESQSGQSESHGGSERQDDGGCNQPVTRRRCGSIATARTPHSRCKAQSSDRAPGAWTQCAPRIRGKRRTRPHRGG